MSILVHLPSNQEYLGSLMIFLQKKPKLYLCDQILVFSSKIPIVDIIELMLLPGTPQVSKETDSYMQSTHGMSTHNGHSFTPCKAKIVLEKISCHFSISDSIGMNLFFGSHVRLLTKFGTISSTCFKPDGLFQMDVALKIGLFLICSLLS